jgi:cysteine desulfurase/selenocysteine lyase
MENIRQHEIDITTYALNTLTSRFGDDIVIHGSRDVSVRGATISFAYKDVHPHDVSQVLDQTNVCVRAGHHCAKPLMRLLGSNATVRASFYLYNTNHEVDALCDALSAAGDFFTL